MGRSFRLADLTWPEVRARVDTLEGGAVLAVPIGSTEQHGPHLPLSTDTDIAVALCERLAEANSRVIVAPAVAYGSSGEHAGFPGTLSIGQAALELLGVIELCRSATPTFEHVMLVCGHGGNAEALARAVAILRSESRDVRLFLPRWQGDPHAGHEETSMLLALDAARVQLAKAVPGDTRPDQPDAAAATAGRRSDRGEQQRRPRRPGRGPTPRSGAALLHPTSASDLCHQVEGFAMSRRASDRVAVVTGAGRGIGAATVLALVADGWKVLAVDRAENDPALPYPLASADELDALVSQANPPRRR